MTSLSAGTARMQATLSEAWSHPAAASDPVAYCSRVARGSNGEPSQSPLSIRAAENRPLPSGEA